MIWALIQVGLGGAIGSMLRLLAGLGAVRLFGQGFPMGIISVNVVGSLIMGSVVVFLEQRGQMHLSPLLMTGLLGGFTTFSAFSLEAFALFERGSPVQAGFYVLSSVGLSIGALVIGVVAARAVLA